MKFSRENIFSQKKHPFRTKQAITILISQHFNYRVRDVDMHDRRKAAESGFSKAERLEAANWI
jgi:hypothetical protein